MIEHFVSLNDARHFTGARFTINVAANAHLQHIKLALKTRSVTTLPITICCWLTMPPHLATVSCWVAQCLRHNTSTQLNGENSMLRIDSLAMPVKNEVCDTRTWLERDKGFCNSRQLHKTIVSDKGRAVFNGLIEHRAARHQNGWSDDQQ
ncbi:SufD family Fe-S cluster assembly protein [Escherichia coli]